MKYSMKLQYYEISLGQMLHIIAKLWINCLNIKNDVPLNNKSTQMTYLKEC